MYQYSELPTFSTMAVSPQIGLDAFQALFGNEIAPSDTPNAGPYVGEGVETDPDNGDPSLPDDEMQDVDPEDDEMDDDMDDDMEDELNPDGAEDIRRDDRNEIPSTNVPELNPQSPNEMRI